MQRKKLASTRYGEHVRVSIPLLLNDIICRRFLVQALESTMRPKTRESSWLEYPLDENLFLVQLVKSDWLHSVFSAKQGLNCTTKSQSQN